MEKLIVVSDLHVHNYRQFDVDNSRLRNSLKVIEDIFDYAHVHGITTVLFGGDLFHQPQAVPSIVMRDTIRTFKYYESKYPNIIWYGISGNHDHCSKNLINNPASTSLGILSDNVKNFVLIDRQVVTVAKGVTVVGMPYFEYKSEYQQVLEAMETVKKSDVAILLMHQTPKGIIGGNFGYDLDPEDYHNYDLVFCGHIHEYQKLTKNFYVVGSPIPQSFSDEGIVKGFLVVEPKTKKVDFVELTGYPKFVRTNKVTLSESTDYVQEFSESIMVDEESVNEARFGASLSNKEILTNYFQASGLTDNDVLEVGLSFL